MWTGRGVDLPRGLAQVRVVSASRRVTYIWEVMFLSKMATSVAPLHY